MRLRVVLLVLVCALFTAPLALALPPARVKPLTPRVTPLTARVITLKPRITSLAPKHVAPNKFQVGTDVLFAFGSAKLSNQAGPLLKQVVSKLRGEHGGTVTVTGYTDSIGKKGFNLKLSRQRAASVVAYLHGHAGNVGYKAAGRGEADPVAPNKIRGHDNPSGRQQNRRVELSYAR
ncbi:MAG: OmpA family protein [Solirubrobacterales bacterium]|nr:OmpA family protein [Solirubrobacterales bacterium]